MKMAKVPPKDYDPEERQSFSSILDMPASLAVRPKPAPTGTYMAMVLGHADYGKSTKKGTGFAKVLFKLIEVSDDVDIDALEAYLTKPDGSTTALGERTVPYTLWDTPNSAYRMRDFLLSLGIEEKDEDGNQRKLGDMMQEIPGRQVWIHIRHRPSEDGEGLFADVDRTIKVE
jgi:hypothetical protein